MKIIDRIALLALLVSLIMAVYNHESLSAIGGWFCAFIWCLRVNFDKK